MIRWCAIGDSFTYLNDHPDETNHYVTKGYLSRTLDSLRAHGLDAELTNIGSFEKHSARHGRGFYRRAPRHDSGQSFPPDRPHPRAVAGSKAAGDEPHRADGFCLSL